MGLIKNNHYFKSLPQEVADILERFDPNKPILEWKPKPTFRTQKEKDAYWDLQRKYWIEGYNGIPPTLYFKTMEFQIKDRISGQYYPSICRDVDLYHHVRKDISRKNKRSHGTLKGRGIGLSTDFASDIFHTLLTKPGANVNVTSKDQSAISTLYGEKILTGYEGLDDYIKPVEKNRNDTKSTSYLALWSEYYDINGNLKKGISKINAYETSDSDISASKFSSSGAALGVYDELPLHRRRKKLLDSSLYCYMNQRTGEMDGFLEWGGTIEATLNNDELIAFRKTIESAETWKSDITFLDAVWGSFSKDKEYKGWTDWEFGIQRYEKELEAFLATGDEESVKSFRKNKPRSLNDLFELLS